MKKIIALFAGMTLLLSATVCLASADDPAREAEQLLIQHASQYGNGAHLMDLDDDAIPELVYSDDSYGEGYSVVQVKEGKLTEAPDRIWFGTGLGVSEKISFFMNGAGRIMIYRDGSTFLFSENEETRSIQAVYHWSDLALTPIRILETVLSRDFAGYRMESGDPLYHNEAPMTEITPEEAEEKRKKFHACVMPFVVWPKEEESVGLTDIWEVQKKLYRAANGDEKAIVLQLGNPLMTVNGQETEIDPGRGTAPVEKNGRTLIPVRAVVEAMGGTVQWEEATNTAVLICGETEVKLTVNQPIALCNQEERILDVAPLEQNGRTMLPIRFIAESFGFRVNWEGLTQHIIITEKSSADMNRELLSCMGKTKREINEQYGVIIGSDYWMGGKYYRYYGFDTEFFYEKPNGEYDYGTHDDVDADALCTHLYAKLSELLNTPHQTRYTVEELEAIFGKYEFFDSMSDDFYPGCTYQFIYNGYRITVSSEQKDPLAEYVYVFKDK